MQSITPQNRHAVSLTKEFLDVHWDRKKPLLLGYSGGPDSKALLCALLECGVKPHLAHVDHGWREESKEEAEWIRREAEKLGLPFYTTRLDIPKKEDAARTARLSFFRSLMEPFEALLLAHHADDLAETVLKRVLEGAHPAFLSGMEPVSHQCGMNIWRPFLKLRRSEIERFLNGGALIDSSNFDPTYLRARMRLSILPLLNEQFGKEIGENLALLSVRSAELKKYLDQKIAPVKIHRGVWGILVDLGGLERIERRHLLQKIGRFTRSVLETVLDWIEKGGQKKNMNKKIFVDDAIVWIPPREGLKDAVKPTPALTDFSVMSGIKDLISN